MQIIPDRSAVAFAFVTLILATPAVAQRSGLLLGLSSDSGYRTIWIAPVARKVVVAAQQPMLVVPADDGFHLVGVARWCSVSDLQFGFDPGPFVDERDIITDRRLTSAQASPDSGSMELECAVARSIVTPQRDSVARAALSVRLRDARTAEDSLFRTPEKIPGSDVCSFDYLHITFITSRYVSAFEEDGATEYCNPAKPSSSQHRFTMQGDSTIALLPLLHPAQASRLVARWNREKGSCAKEKSPDESWGVVRVLGGWQLAFETRSGMAICGGSSFTDGFTIVEPAPAVIARRDPVASWLPALRAAVPKLDDAFVSPSGDLIVARAARRLFVFAARAGKLGAPVLRFDLLEDETVVMAEWALGANVDRWTRTLTVDVPIQRRQ